MGSEQVSSTVSGELPAVELHVSAMWPVSGRARLLQQIYYSKIFLCNVGISVYALAASLS